MRPGRRDWAFEAVAAEAFTITGGHNDEMPAWDDYQEEVAAFFRSLGLDAETNVTLKGVRTSHDVDVVVRSSHVGFDLLWLVECKHWNSAVPKLHVLGLREIVIDLGADRGIIVAEKGFQRGSREAAELTNIQLASLAELKASAEPAIGMAELRALHDRLDDARRRYWELDKSTRIAHGLRPDVGVPGYSARSEMDVLDAALSDAFRGKFPVDTRDSPSLLVMERIEAADPKELVRIATGKLEKIEALLRHAEKVKG